MIEADEFGGKNERVEQLELINVSSGARWHPIDAPLAAEPYVWSANGRYLTVPKSRESLDSAAGPSAIKIQLGREPKVLEGNSQKGHVAPAIAAVPHLAIAFRGGSRWDIKVVAADQKSGVFVTDLNPKLAPGPTLAEYRWSDSWGRTWGGTLILPSPGNSPSSIPLVVQLNGNGRTSEFANEPDFASHASGLLANSGMAVLTVNCSANVISDSDKLLKPPSYFDGVRDCIESAVHALSVDHNIDPSRVGLVGFSYAGNLVWDAVTFSKIKFAAAVINDSIANTVLGYTLSYGSARPGITQFDSPSGPYSRFSAGVGAKLYGAGVKKWLAHSPLFNADRIESPLLIEKHGIDFPCACWDIFTVLKRSKRPVEMVMYPTGEHDLRKPLERVVARQRTVDWFAFWLLGRQRSFSIPGVPDDEQTRKSQYDRWTELRYVSRLAR